MKSLFLLVSVGLTLVATSPLQPVPRLPERPEPRVVTMETCKNVPTITLAEGDVLQWELEDAVTPRRCGIKIMSDSGTGKFEIRCQNFDLPETVVLKIKDPSRRRAKKYKLRGGPNPLRTEGETFLRLVRTDKQNREEVSLSCTIRCVPSEAATTTTTTTTPTPTTTTTSTTITTAAAAVDNLCSPECGRTAPNNRIVGGSDAAIENHPYQVGLASGTFLFCGGTLINNQWIVTAAHCTVDGYLNGVYLGGTTISASAENILPVETIINHPGYDASTLNNDIALVKLAYPVSFSEKVYPACLPQSSSDNYAGITTIISGWGTLASGGSRPQQLQQAQVTTLTNQECTTSPNVYPNHWITDNMICAKGDGIDSCQGDSGGPLITEEGELIGVVSFGIGCADPTYPGVYTRVTEYLDFINENIGCN